jgi:hypothetical protein
MTEAKIQALVDRGLLWRKMEVEWRAVTTRPGKYRTIA